VQNFLAKLLTTIPDREGAVEGSDELCRPQVIVHGLSNKRESVKQSKVSRANE